MATPDKVMEAIRTARNYARYSGFYGRDPDQVEFSIKENNMMALAINVLLDPEGYKEIVDRMISEYRAEMGGL
jgi:hypothetical protein